MADTTEQQAPVVDESSISSVRPDHVRKNSLENHLQNRPNRVELVDSACPFAHPFAVPPHFFGGPRTEPVAAFEKLLETWCLKRPVTSDKSS